MTGRKVRVKRGPLKPHHKGAISVVVGLVILLVVLWFMSSKAHAQQPPNVTTQPFTDTTVQNGSGAISTGVSGAFQSVFAAPDRSSNKNQKRQSCLIQNNSAANPMFVYFGPIASATTATAYKLAVGASITCTPTPSIVIEEQISVSGTLADIFFAIQQ